LTLDFTLQSKKSLIKAQKDSSQLSHRNMVIHCNAREITTVHESAFLEIISNSKIDQLTLDYLPRAVEYFILSKLTNITSLHINSVRPEINTKIDFPNLKQMFTLDNSFLLAIGKHRIEKLRIADISPEIFTFLETCNDLKDLTLGGFRGDGDRKFTNFQLEKLRVVTNYSSNFYPSSWDLSECEKFLSSQSHCLKEIYIKNTSLFRFCSDVVMAYALNNMNLTTLHSSHPILDETIHKVNRELKNLEIDLENKPNTAHLIECCPAVERIDLTRADSVFTFMLPLVSQHMTNLQHIKLLISLPQPIQKIEANFEKLVSLHVILWGSEGVDILIKILRCCPNLNLLILETPKGFMWKIRSFLQFLTSIENVEEIHCKGDFGLTQEMVKYFDEMLQNLPLKLKFLKIEVDNPTKFQDIGDSFIKSRVRFTVMQRQSEPY
jgi:hypothetical protein